MTAMISSSTSDTGFRTRVQQKRSNRLFLLGEILKRRQLVSGCQLQLAIQAQVTSSCHRKLGEILLEQRAISPFDLQAALREQSWRQKGFWVID